MEKLLLQLADTVAAIEKNATITFNGAQPQQQIILDQDVVGIYVNQSMLFNEDTGLIDLDSHDKYLLNLRYPKGFYIYKVKIQTANQSGYEAYDIRFIESAPACPFCKSTDITQHHFGDGEFEYECSTCGEDFEFGQEVQVSEIFSLPSRASLNQAAGPICNLPF